MTTLTKYDGLLLASKKSNGFVDGGHLEIMEYASDFINDGLVFRENTSLTLDEMKELSRSEKMLVAFVDANGNEIIFHSLCPQTAMLLVSKADAETEEWARVYREADGIKLLDYIKQSDTSALTEAFGAEKASVILATYSEYEYHIVPMGENEFLRIDLQDDAGSHCNTLMTKSKVLEYADELIDSRIEECRDEEPKVLEHYQKLKKILSPKMSDDENAMIEEIERNRTRAIRLENHLKCKAIGKLLDEWLDMQSYTVYLDEFGQLYYIDEIKANGSDRSEYIEPTDLRKLIRLVIAEINTVAHNASDSYTSEQLDELYYTDIRILKHYLAW